MQTASDVHFVSRMVEMVAPLASRDKIRYIACVETALGLLNIRDIAAADPRVEALLASLSLVM